MTSPSLPAAAKSSSVRIASFAALALLAFAGNSLLCRLALAHTPVDVASFTGVRLLAGAATLWLLVKLRGNGRAASAPERATGNWISAFALFAYASAFSLAYTQLSAATGALLLFGSVQATMIAVGLWRGERLSPLQIGGLCLALAGLVALLLPGLSAPPLVAALLMVAAGMAWGVYSLRGRNARDPVGTTAGNFLRSLPFAALFGVAMIGRLVPDAAGIGYAVASGALTSGVGYAIWYAALPHLGALRAAVMQLSVPVIAAAGGLLLISEPITLRFVLCSLAILGGVLVVIVSGRRGARG
ncbi:MAG: DMT family transporter [Pseudoxanthomonas sp.]